MEMIKTALRTLFSNFWYKVISLIAALMIWGYVQGEEIVEYNRRIMVTISVGRGYSVRGSSVRSVDATLRGPRFLLGETESKSLEASLFIPSGQTGNIETAFDRAWIPSLDLRIKISVRDPYMTIFVDELVEKSIGIREVLKGAPKPGFFIEEVSITPNTLKVEGLKADLQNLSEVFTEPVDVTGISESKTIDALLSLPPEMNIKTATEQVRVLVKLGDRRLNKNYPNVAIGVAGKESGYRISPSEVSVVLQGTQEALDKVQRSDLTVFVDLDGEKPGKVEKEVKIKIPPDVVLISIEPPRVSVRIEGVVNLIEER
jgi:YbbR domain-containing protein